MAELMTPDASKLPGWGDDDLAAMLRHQLQAPLQFDLTASETVTDAGWTTTTTTLTNCPRTFGELFSHAEPPLELLKLVKDYAKIVETALNNPLPKEISMVLYFTSILLAKVRCGKRISSVSDDKIRQGGQWIIAQAWVDDRLRDVVRAALRGVR